MFQFQNCTEKANKALNLALEKAESFGQHYVGTEYVLLGLMAEGTGVAAAALKSVGVREEALEEALMHDYGNVSGCICVQGKGAIASIPTREQIEAYLAAEK